MMSTMPGAMQVAAKEEAAFEAWATEHIKENPDDWPMLNGHGGEYRLAFLAWQARAAYEPEPPPARPGSVAETEDVPSDEDIARVCNGKASLREGNRIWRYVGRLLEENGILRRELLARQADHAEQVELLRKQLSQWEKQTQGQVWIPNEEYADLCRIKARAAHQQASVEVPELKPYGYHYESERGVDWRKNQMPDFELRGCLPSMVTTVLYSQEDVVRLAAALAGAIQRANDAQAQAVHQAGARKTGQDETYQELRGWIPRKADHFDRQFIPDGQGRYMLADGWEWIPCTLRCAPAKAGSES